MTYLFFKHFHLINLSPLLLITICFIIGINYHFLLTLFAIIFLCILCGFFLAPHNYQAFFRQALLCSFFIIAGALLHEREWHNYHDFYTSINGQNITITGTVTDLYETIVHYKKSTVITITAHNIATKNSCNKNNKTFIFYTKCNKNICVGDVITFLNVSCKKPSHEDFQRYQIKEQIIATLFDETISYHIEHRPTWSLRRWLWNQKNRLLHQLQNKLSPECFRFFSPLFLGNRTYIKNELEETNEQFKVWGIAHFLARSGLHLVLFIFIWQTLFSLMPLPLLVKQIFMLIISCIYFILTWTSAPFTRSFLLLVLHKLCFFNKISFHLVHYLTLVCLLFLLYCPLYLFFLDFQLSFSLTFALAWFNQVTTQYKK